MRFTRLTLTTIALGMAAIAMPANGQISVYYVTEGTSGVGQTHAWQGGQELYSFTWSNAGEIPIHIDGDFIRQAQYGGGGSAGTEYDLAGVPTGNQNFFDNGGATAYDAGFDGQNVYIVDWISGAVAMYDIDYANRVGLFTANASDLGITYDGGTNTLWTSSWTDGQIRQWELDGTLLFQFSTGGTSLGALAWDPADDSLWVYNSSVSQHQQYDKNGNLLSSYSTSTYILGGEFQTGQGGAYFMRMSGQCPGDVTMSWSGAVPNRPQALVFGRERGEFTIPNNLPCGGTVLGLMTEVRLVDPPGIFDTGNDGSGSLSRRVGTAVCGGYLQLIQGGSCETTNVVQVP